MEPFGFAPQITMQRASGKSWKAVVGILPYIPLATSVVGAAQMVFSRREAPSLAEAEVVQQVIGQKTIGSTIVKRNDRLATPIRRIVREASGDLGYRLGPGNGLETGLSFAPDATHRVQHPVFVLQASVKAGDLAADEASSIRMIAATFDLLHPASLNHDLEGAGVGTVHRAGGTNGSSRHLFQAWQAL